ncbi:MAG: sodium-dependent transporter [Legionellales bacterium]|nr:sodium-dependent transporter [Legionellales bacterium]
MSTQFSTSSEQWSSSWAFMMAAAGAAVGLGNIWKFPYITGMNGGGAFVLMYLICVLILGVPLLMAEIAIGRLARKNPAGSIAYLAHQEKRSRAWGLIGFWIISAGFLILTYYSVIAGWALAYEVLAVREGFLHASAHHIDELFTSLLAHPAQLILWHSLIMIATTLVVARGVQKGIEKTVMILFPAMVILLVLIAAYSLQTPFFIHGLTFLFHPHFEKLSAHNLLVALGHAFFTLSIATGSIMMYGAYLPKHISVAKTSLFIAAADTFVALIAGLAIYPLVFAHGLQPAAGPGLIFKTLPLAFSAMEHGNLLAILFFAMLVFAAFTSTISLLEPTVAWLIETCAWSRWQAALVSGSVAWALGLLTVFSFNIAKTTTILGLTFFAAIDYLTSNIMLPLGGLLIALFAAWIIKTSVMRTGLNIRQKYGFYLWLWTSRIIVPIAILFVMINVLGLGA